MAGSRTTGSGANALGEFWKAQGVLGLVALPSEERKAYVCSVLAESKVLDTGKREHR